MGPLRHHVVQVGNRFASSAAASMKLGMLKRIGERVGDMNDLIATRRSRRSHRAVPFPPLDRNDRR